MGIDTAHRPHAAKGRAALHPAQDRAILFAVHAAMLAQPAGIGKPNAPVFFILPVRGLTHIKGHGPFFFQYRRTA